MDSDHAKQLIGPDLYPLSLHTLGAGNWQYLYLAQLLAAAENIYWIRPIPFALDIVRKTDGISPNIIGKILDGILPVGFHKFVTELWALVHEMHFMAGL